MPTKLTKFIAAITVQVVVIFAIIIFKYSILVGGTEVLLKIAPVDPRDMLRGDYATFQYDISNVDPYSVAGEIKNGDTVYVALYQGGKYWAIESVRKVQPEDGSVFIKGKVESGGSGSSAESFSIRFMGSRMHIVYGIEQFFIPEGSGRSFSFFGKEAAARVVIDDNGNAVLKQIYVNDKPWP